MSYKVFVVQYKSKNSKKWANKKAYFVRNDACFYIRQIRAETEETGHSPIYRVKEFVEKKD